MLRFYPDVPGRAFDTELLKWVRVDDSNEPVPDFEMDLLNEAKQKADIAFYEGPFQVEHFTQHLFSAADEEVSVKRFSGSFPVLDEAIEGLETGEVVIVTGRTKNGKTLFAESWINSILAKDPEAKALILSFEVQTKKLLWKYTDNPTMHLYVPKTLKTMDFEWLKERCLEAKIKHKCNILFVDHLHFMVDMNTKQNMSLNIGAFMRRLKQEIAIGMNMAVILIAHQGQLKDGQSASSSTVRDSSFITQESDMTIVVSRRKNFDAVEMADIESDYGEERAAKIRSRILLAQELKNKDDKYSAGLAIVSVDLARRSGCYEFKKMFQKVGNFLEEL